MIDELLSGLSVADFLERHWTRVPHVEKGAAAHLAHLGSVDRLGAILDRAGTDALAARDGRPWEGAGPIDAVRAEGLIAEGYTVLVRNAERHDPDIAALAAAFEADFAAPVDVHVYRNPAGGRGFSWHYDAEDVFLLQASGEKDLALRKNSVNPWPLRQTLPRDMRYEAERAFFGLKSRLAAGDWLYIPNGFWHEARAVTESVTIAVGVLAPSAIDALDALRRRLLGSLFWRQRLPVAGAASPLDREERLEQYRELLAELGRDLAREITDDRFVEAICGGGARPQPIEHAPAVPSADRR